ncbi:5-formyltetrahydrofolate cyclo-ligase [Brevibacterium ammoniilyticum]|uniref:5-formyltetrahydrofolate cyclo-ligase n=1 Tax=Brevibacterium ammoniilyticum TaxID=1046555 RepID=UPI003139774A
MDPVSSKAELRALIRARRSARARQWGAHSDDSGASPAEAAAPASSVADLRSPPPAPPSSALSPSISDAVRSTLDHWWPSADLSGRIVVAYAALPGEPDVDTVVDGLRERGARVFLPVVTRIGEALQFGEVRAPMAELTPQGRWGIREPRAEHSASSLFAEAAPDLLLVPALGFGAGGARLGNGGGFYDRTFGPLGEVPLGDVPPLDASIGDAPPGPSRSHAQPPDSAGPRVVGVCFAEEADLPGLVVEPWDLRVPEAITEDGLRVL